MRFVKVHVIGMPQPRGTRTRRSSFFFAEIEHLVEAFFLLILKFIFSSVRFGFFYFFFERRNRGANL